jgi:acyl-homoserine-lactone acylase
MSSRRIVLLLAFALANNAARAQAPAYHPQKGTEILWDRYGVPHIFAKSVPDMFFSLGYAQTEAHGDLLLHALGASRGRAAQYFGPGESDLNLRNDRWLWTNEVPIRSVQWLTAQTPEFRRNLDAYAAGINAYAHKHPEALVAEVKQVLPITTLDIIEREQAFYNFEFTAGMSLANSPAPKKTASLTDAPSPFIATEEDKQDGSNGWAIGPSHTTSGNAMLLMNPHLTWAGEESYFEVQLTAPGINLYGAGQIGVPALRFVFSEQLAITNTVNTNNGHLLYRITEAPGGYRFDGKVLPYTRASYPIKIRQPNGSFTTETVEVLKTLHGPIIRHDDGVPIALYAAGLDKPFLLEQVYKMSTAHSFAEYQAQLKRLQIPMYNILYADRDGHIEYLFNAPIPRRSEGDWEMWAKPVPGDTSRLLPTGSLTYEELPKSIDPASGYVQNSNEPPWDAAWPTMIDPKQYAPYVSPSWPYFRSDRGLRMLSEDRKISFDMLLQKKLSTRSEAADRFLPDLFIAVDKHGTSRAKQAAAVLKSWDRQTEANSRGALLFWAWFTRFGKPENFATPYAMDKPLTTPAGIKDPSAAAAMLDAAAAETIQRFGALDTPWGNYMHIQINNQSDGDTKAPRTPPMNGVDLPANGGPGSLGIFRVLTPGAPYNGTSTPVHGDGFTLAVEFSKPIRAKSLISYGECSQPGCAHHTDELQLVANKQWRDVWRTRPEILANLERKDVF